MTSLTHIDSGQTFDLFEGFSVPVDLVAGVLTEQGDYLSGGSTSFSLPRTPNNENLIGDGRNMIRVVLTQGASTIVGELLVRSESKGGYQCELEDIRTSAFRRLKDLPIRSVYLDDLTHLWVGSNIIANRTSGWVYPFVDYGYMVRRGQRLNASNFQGNIRNDVYNFRPGMFAFDLIERAFRQIGWDIDLPTGWFRQLVIPCTQPIKRPTGEAQAASGAMYLTAGYVADEFYNPIPFNLNTNAAVFTGGNFTAPFSGLYNYRLMIPGFNSYTREKSVAAHVLVNGGVINRQVYFFKPGETLNTETTGTIYLNAGDVMSVQAANNGSPSTRVLFPGSGARLEIAAFDTMAWGNFIQMKDTLPDMAAADLIKWVLAGTNMVLDIDAAQSRLRAVPFWEYYQGTQEMNIEQDSYQFVTLPNAGQNNYIGYSGNESFANGGFTIQDSRLTRENTLFASGFHPSQMGAAYGGLTSLAQMYADRPGNPSFIRRTVGADLFSIDPVDTSLRLILIKRLPVSEVFRQFTTIEIADINDADTINWGYFYDSLFPSEVSLAYQDLGGVTGINLANLAFRDYASDFVNYQGASVQAALLPGDVSGFDFSRLVPFKGRLYRIMKINQYVEGGLVNLELRRVGIDSPNMGVLPQIGKDSTTSTGASQNDGDTITFNQMNRLQIVFGGYAAPILIGADNQGDLYPQVGNWGVLNLVTGFFTIPASGYYSVYFQVTANSGEAQNDIWYEVYDGATKLFERRHDGNARAQNIANEEYLNAGWTIRFNVDFNGAHLPDYTPSLTFATITQRGLNG